MFSTSEMKSAAAELRLLADQTRAVVDSLRDSRIWSGDDAHRFVLDWNEKVTEPLQAAANKLDGLDFGEIIEVVVEATTGGAS